MSKRSHRPYASLGALALVALLGIGSFPAASQGARPGVQVMEARLTQGLYETAAAWTGYDAYVFGGRGSNGATDEILRYVPSLDYTFTSPERLPTARSGAAAVYTGSGIVVFGGQREDGTILGEILLYDNLEESLVLSNERLPRGLVGHVAVYGDGYAYILGGLDANFQVSDRIYRYDPLSNEIVTLPTTLPEPIRRPSALWDGSGVLVFGGEDSADEVLDTVYRYDPYADQVTSLHAALPHVNAIASAVFDGANAYVFGGSIDIGEQPTDRIVRYDVLADASAYVNDVLPSARSHTSAVWADDAAYIFGGLSEGSHLDEIVRFVPSQGAPTSGPTTRPPGPTSGVATSGIVPPDGAHLRGTVTSPTGAAVVGVPVFLLASQGGVLKPVGSSLTGADGRYGFQKTSQTPDYVAAFQDGHLTLQPIDPTAAANGGTLPPIEIPIANGQPLQPEQVAALSTALEELRAFPVGDVARGALAQVNLESYHGLLGFEVSAEGTGLTLVVAKLRTKGFEEIKDPPGTVHRWFALALVDAEGNEVPIDSAKLHFGAPTGVKAGSDVRLHHYVLPGQKWETETLSPKDGVYVSDLSSLSLFAIGSARPGLSAGAIFAIIAIIGAGGLGYLGYKSVQRRQKAPTVVPADGVPTFAPAPPKPAHAIELKDPEFLVSDLNFKAADKKILTDVSFGFAKGQILALLGPSGCGKSTLLKCIIGENKFEGDLSVFGFKPNKDRDVLKRIVGYVSQDTQLYVDMKVRENVEYFGRQYGLTPQQIKTQIPYLLKTLGIDDRAEQPVKVLSGGQQRRTSIAATLVHSPALLILDEPTSGLDPITRRNLWKFIRQANRELGVSVIVTTHFLDEAEFADRIVILRRGEVIATGSPAELIKSLPGGGKVVVVELQTTSAHTEERIRKATADLIKKGNIKKVDITGYTVRFFVVNPQEASRVLFEMFQNIEVAIRSLTTEESRMEDVFVHFAGEPWQGGDT